MLLLALLEVYQWVKTRAYSAVSQYRMTSLLQPGRTRTRNEGHPNYAREFVIGSKHRGPVSLAVSSLRERRERDEGSRCGRCRGAAEDERESWVEMGTSHRPLRRSTLFPHARGGGTDRRPLTPLHRLFCAPVGMGRFGD